MAPEQLRGARPTPAFDVYAFGILMFEMLTGKRPFARLDGGSLASALERLEVDAPLLSSQLPDADPTWERVVARCLARIPASRFRDVGEIRAALLNQRRWPRLRAGKRVPPAVWVGLAGGLVVAAVLARQLWAPAPPPTAGLAGAAGGVVDGIDPSRGSGVAADPRLKAASSRKPGQIIVALSEWPGHMPLVVGNGGLTTQPGSAATAEGLDLKIVFIDDPAKKTASLLDGSIDATWTTIDEQPILMGAFRKADVPVKTFLQLDWSRGGDACVAAAEIKTVEDLLGKKAAMLMFSPGPHPVRVHDHEFSVHARSGRAPPTGRELLAG